MTRPFPAGRIGLKQFLRDAGIAKNTFHLRYRNDPRWVKELDIQEDRDHRLHFPESAGHALRLQRGRAPHGNTGRPTGRICGGCGERVHPRLTHCRHCGYQQPVSSSPKSSDKPRPSTAALNGCRKAELQAMKELAAAALAA